MADLKKLKGRPPKEGKRSKKIDVRFSEEEYKLVLTLEEGSGLAKADLIRMRVLGDAGKTLLNARELIGRLDRVGLEMARIGNNINQLARYGNTMQLKGALDPAVAARFNELLATYVRMQQELEVSIRKVIRLMGK